MMIIDVCFTWIFILYHQFCCVKLIVATVLCLIVIDIYDKPNCIDFCDIP